MRALIGFLAGLVAGAIVGVLAGSALGRHDDRGLVPWQLLVEG